MLECPICYSNKVDDPGFVCENTSAYAFVPTSPILLGHLLILPKRHAKLSDLTEIELLDIQQLIEKMKVTLLKLAEALPEIKGHEPMLVSMMDTMHASIPEHFHFHLIPSKNKIRDLIESYSTKENIFILRNDLQTQSEIIKSFL